MEIEHDTVTQEPMSFNLVVEVATLESKESDIVTKEPVFLKRFVETVVQTKIDETQEVAVQTKNEVVETREVSVRNEITEAAETQEVAVQMEI